MSERGASRGEGPNFVAGRVLEQQLRDTTTVILFLSSLYLGDRVMMMMRELRECAK